MKELIKMRREHSVFSKGQETVNMFLQYERIIIDLLKNEFENGEIIEEKLDSTIHKFVTTDEGVLWNREHLLNLGKLQIVGHTKQQEVTFVEDTNGLYIDTGACAGNKLSAVIIENNKILEILSEKTDFNDIF